MTDVPALLVVWGALRPVVLIPADAAEWPADRRDAVLSHELAHVQRHDWIVQIGAAIAGAALWFHPLAWLAGARLRRESELACDDIVLGLGVERTAYASHLIALARAFQARGRAALPAPAIARPSTLQRRIHTMLNAHADRRPLSRFARFAIAAAMACASLPLAAIGQAPGEVSGTLRDPSGRVLPGASVRLTQDGSGMKYEAETTPDGQFQLVGVAPGSYVLSAWLSGFDRGVETVTVAANTPLRRDLPLRVASLQETVSVIAGAAAATPPPTPRRPAAAPAMKPCTASPIGGNIKVPMKIKHVPPVYPAAARDAGIEGTILLVAHIGPDGRVDDVRPFSQGDPDLTDAAIVAVRQWQFTPTLLNCDPIDVRMLVTTRFSSHG